MEEILAEILLAEKKAAAALEQARRDAAMIADEAARAAEQVLSETKTRSEEDSERETAAAREAAEVGYQQMLADAEKTASANAARAKKKIPTVVKATVKAVLEWR